MLPLPQQREQKTRMTDKLLDRILDAAVGIVLKRQKAVFIVIGMVSALAVGGIFFVRVETNPLEYLKKDTPIRRHFDDSRQKLSGSFTLSATLESQQPGYFEDSRHLSEIQHLQQYLESLPGVDKTISFADYVMLTHYALNEYDPAFYVIPQEGFEVRMAINNYKGLLGDDLYSRFMTPELNKANILMMTHLSSSKDILAIKDRILQYARQNMPEHLSVEVTGFGVAISASSHLLVAGQTRSILLGLALIFTIMFFMFLSAKVGLIALIPNGFPILVNFGVMGWSGIPFSASTSLIASIAIGLAVDDTIHYMHRYHREFKKDLDKDRALRDTVKSVGRPIIFTTLTIGIGFFVLMFSQFRPTAVFGLLMVVTMLSALIGDLILLPALMRRVELVTAWDLMKLMPTTAGLSSGFAHELNQPLNAIKMGSDFLKMMAAQRSDIPEGQLLEVVDEIGLQADRAAAIVNRLQALGKRADLTRHPFNINDCVNEVVGVFSHQLHLEDIEIDLELAPQLPLVNGHPNRLGQVVYNLLSNAREAIEAKRRVDGGADRATIRMRTFSAGGEVILTVSDTGVGISEHHLGRIYEPFFSTKAAGQGKGLGLSISRQILKDYGARIDVESKAHQGSTFRVSFPCAAP
jgi:signal transduction histidine kinase